jgi:hypothetical protein
MSSCVGRAVCYQTVLRVIPSGVKRRERETRKSHTSSAEVNNDAAAPPLPPYLHDLLLNYIIHLCCEQN